MRKLLPILLLLLALPAYGMQMIGFGAGGEEVLGYDTIGASSFAVPTGDIRCSPLDTASNSGTVTKVYLYCSKTSTGANVKLGLYTDSSGVPNAKVGTEQEFVIGTTSWSAQWREFSGLNWSVTASTGYWICQSWSPTAMTQYYTDMGSGNYRSWLSWTYSSSWPATHGAVGSWNAYKFSAYAIIEY